MTNIIITLIIAAITCFFGFKLNKILIAIVGFIVGFQLGGAIMPELIEHSMAITVSSVVIGILLALLSFKLYVAGVFLLCAFVTYTVCITYIPMDTVKEIVGILAGFIVGILGAKFTKPVMIISTSISGAFMLVDTGFTLLNFVVPIMSLIVGVLIAIVGAKYQFSVNKDIE